MKKLILLIILIFAGSMIFAQTSKRTSAYNYLRNGKLDKAKEYIDPTITHEKTLGDPKTWYYRGNIYLQIALSDVPEFQNLDPDPLAVAYDSYVKAIELDEKESYRNDIDNNMRVIAAKYYDLAVTSYNAQEFGKAAVAFEKAYRVNNEVGVMDTTALYNAAIAAQTGEENDLAVNYYKQLIGLNFRNPQIYSSLSEIYKKEGDTALALQTVKDGRVQYPANFDLLIAETNIYLASGDNENALKNLELALDKDSTNSSIYFALGTNYDQLNNNEKAEMNYMKAIEYDSAYFDAYYNLGALFVNQAAEIQLEASDLPLEETEKYDKLMDEANGILTKSLPYLERAYELKPDDPYTKRSLKQIYARLNMQDKLKALDEE
jgi:tetratricopeptide (TPR) repeat protein